MSERKVLNKYYPIDYDPRRLPRQKGMGSIEDKIMVIRTMAPFHMRCKTCGNYIYRGTKFNSRVETVKGERYLGTIPIRRFYIRCPKCVATITFRTDPENQDYAMESGATRNFEANRMWQLMEKREADAKAEEERANPMVALENRTAKSNQQMIMQENLEELYELAEKIGTGGGEEAKSKALNILQTAIQADKDTIKARLEAATEEIMQLQEDVRDEAGRLDEDAEWEEDDAQVQVRKIMAEIDPSELLMLNMDEEEERFSKDIYVQDKKKEKLMEALDKSKSKKKFAGLVKTGSSGEKKKGMSYKDFQAKVKAAEEKKKADEERRKQAEQSLKNSFAAYGSSSSSEEDEPEESQPEEPKPTEEFKKPPTPEVKVPQEEPKEVPLDQLPPGFVDQEEKDEGVEKPQEQKKRPAEIGSADFWSSVIKKKR